MSNEETKTKTENKAATHRAYSVRNFGDDNKKATGPRSALPASIATGKDSISNWKPSRLMVI